MGEFQSTEVTQILADLRAGSDSAARRLLPLVYDELRRIAADMFRAQPPNHTLEATALVHEAFVRLVRNPEAEFADRAHFLAVAAKAMRNVLIDHARKKKRQKRGRDWERITLAGLPASLTDRTPDLLAVNEALTELNSLHDRQARVVELRFFGGLTIPETAQVLGVSRQTVENDWAMARAWLARKLSPTSRS